MNDQEFQERVLAWIERADNWMERTEDWKVRTDNRMDNLEGRMDNLEGQMSNLGERMGNLQEGLSWIRGKLEGKQESDAALWGKIAVLAAVGSAIIAIPAYFK
jgi:chromosome segregation ATPase